MKSKGSLVNNLSRMTILWASAMFLLGSAALPGAVESCPRPQPPTAEPRTGLFPADAACTLREIETEAFRAHRNASILQMPAGFPDSGALVAHAPESREASESLTRNSERMCRLQETGWVAEPWQRKSLDWLMAEGDAAVDSVERCIAAFPGRDRTEFESAAYRQSLHELSQAAEGMGHPSRVERAQNDLILILNP